MSGMTLYVTKVEIWDNYGFRMATVEAKDEATATVNIEMSVSAGDWQELSIAVFNAIKSMKLEGDKE